MHMSTPTLCIPAPPHISCFLGGWPTQLPGPSHNWRCLFFIGIWNWRELSDMEEYRRRESFEINLPSKLTILPWSHWGFYSRSKIWDSTFRVPYTTGDVYFSLEYGRLESPEPHSWIIQNMYGSLHSEVTILSTYSPLVKGSFTKKITLLQTFEALPGTSRCCHTRYLVVLPLEDPIWFWAKCCQLICWRRIHLSVVWLVLSDHSYNVKLSKGQKTRGF